MNYIFRNNLIIQDKSFKSKITKEINKIIGSGEYILGKETKKFEKNFAKYLRVKNIIGVSNATDALILVLDSLNLNKGDEVITSPFTAYATCAAIIKSGAKLVFADIDKETWLLDIEKTIKKINSRTRAIIPVHIFGNVFDVNQLKKEIKKVTKKKIYIIEDSSQAHGSKIRNKYSGTHGDFSVWSFYPTKNLGGYGDGGAIFVKSYTFYKRLILKRNIGFLNKDYVSETGWNARLDEFQSVVLNFKLNRLNNFNKQKLFISNFYRKHLPKEYFIPQKIQKNVKFNAHIPQFLFSGNVKKLQNYLLKNKIQTNQYYSVPHHKQKALEKNINTKYFPVCEFVCKHSIALPSYSGIKLSELRYIINTIKKYIINENIITW